MKKIIGLLFASLTMFACQESDLFTEGIQNVGYMTRAIDAGFSNDTIFDVAKFKIHGKTRMQTEKVFTRVPASYYSDGDRASVRLRDKRFPENTAGFYISFQTNSPKLTIDFETTLASGSYAGSVDSGLESGVELYEYEGGKMKSRILVTPLRRRFDAVLSYQSPDSSLRSYVLFLPAYNGIKTMVLKTQSGSMLRQSELFNESQQLPILYYGTSITQGACASKYSNSYTALTFLELGHEVINLGFDGAGQTNDQMVEFVVQQPSAAFVVDAVWNMNHYSQNLLEVERRMTNLITRYHQNYPETPILLMSKFNKASFAPGSAWEEALFKKIYLDLRKAGISNLYFQPRGNVSYLHWGGGTHPNNAGMRTVADIINKRLRSMLSGETAQKINLKKQDTSRYYTTGTDNNLYLKGYSGLDSINLADIFPASFIGEYSQISVQNGAKKYVDIKQLSSKSTIQVRYADRDHLGYSAKVIITDDVTCEDVEFNIVAAPVVLPTVSVAGREWMIFNNMALSSETAMADNMEVAQLAKSTEDIERILHEKDIHKYEKLIGHFYNYNKTVPATKFRGKPASSPIGNPCPPGFELPTLTDYRNLIGIPELNVNKKNAAYLQENEVWKSPDNGSLILLANDGPFANGTLPQVATTVKYTKITRGETTLYFINNGAFDAGNSGLLYEEKTSSLLTKDVVGTTSIRISLGRYNWPVEANPIHHIHSGHTGARCVKSSSYETRPLSE